MMAFATEPLIASTTTPEIQIKQLKKYKCKFFGSAGNPHGPQLLNQTLQELVARHCLGYSLELLLLW